MIRFLALVLCCLPGVAQAAGEREKARLESLREQRATLEYQLKETEASRTAAADQLRDTEKAISAAGRKLRALGEDQAAARAELAEREKELEHTGRQMAARQAQLARLLRYQFQPRRDDALTVLLAGGDPNAAQRDRHFLTLLSRAKAELIADLRRDAAETKRLKEVVQHRGDRLAELAQREAAERGVLQQRQQERQAVLKKISGQIKAQRHEIATLKQNERRLGNLIASLAKKAAQAKSAKAAKTTRERERRGSQPAPAQTVKAEPTGAAGAFARLRGKLVRPVKGAVLGRFGARRDDGQSVWKGLFIRAAEGADVRAVAGGVVVFADWLRGYGNLLIIDHEDDFLSVYGNNQTLLADVGQKVGAGAAVAIVGASGGLPESGLYFELRHRGQAFDPGKWLGAP